jgi:tetratricopeptide (TPR) repeat protein
MKLVPVLLVGTILSTIHAPGNATGIAPGPGLGRAAFVDTVADASKLLKSGKAEEAVALLEEHLRFQVGDPDTLDLYGQALAKLDRNDEAAHSFDQALAQLEEKDRRAAAIKKRLSRADELARKRESVLAKITDRMLDSAERLQKEGYSERALTILERLTPIATGKDRREVRKLVDEIRAATTEVKLDSEVNSERPDTGWKTYEFESEHYVIEANLEPEVTERVGDVMDAVFDYYVQLYFDGKRKGGRKATIRIYATHPEMMSHWSGPDRGGGLGGWWSPGEWKVTTYDYRAAGQTLDDMLETLFHEASHQFMTMLAGGGNTPSWLNEGTASFFEGATAMADRRVLWPDAAAGRLRNLNAMLAGQMKSPSFRDVISYNQPGSYPGEYYAWGWGLAYFLQQYEDAASLEYVFRPLYAEYREAAIKNPSKPDEIFEQVFLGKASPLGHATIEEFEADWREWIKGVYLQYFGQARRDLRLEQLERYVKAADKAAKKGKKATVPEGDLLLRALGHIEFVRTKVDDPDRPDPKLLLSQADILERLDRAGSAAPLLEQVLGMTNSGEFELPDKEVAELETRLTKIDAKNAPLRTARARAKGLSVTARRLIDSYSEGDEPLILRSYSLAKLTGAVLDDTEVLLPLAAELRQQAVDAGLLRGSLYKLTTRPGDWTTIFNNQETAWELAEDRIAIEGVRPVGKICTAVPISGEYEVRARFIREGKVRRSSFHGVIFSGTSGGDWMVIGLSGSNGGLMMKRILNAGGAVTDLPLTSRRPVPPVKHDEVLELAVHVHPDGFFEVTLGDRDPVPFQMPLAVPAVGHVGLYVKDGSNVLEDLVVEIMP